MNDAQARALALGAELHAMNRHREVRAQLAASATNRGAALWRWLMVTALVDQARRRLRRQLFDALLDSGPLRYGPLADGPGRHISGEPAPGTDRL